MVKNVVVQIVFLLAHSKNRKNTAVNLANGIIWIITTLYHLTSICVLFRYIYHRCTRI